MSASEMATTQLREDSKVVSECLGTADSIKNTNKFVSRFLNCFDNLGNEQMVFVVEDMSRPAPLAPGGQPDPTTGAEPVPAARWARCPVDGQLHLLTAADVPAGAPTRPCAVDGSQSGS